MHSGVLVGDLVLDIRDEGGIISENDLKNYKIEEKDAITFDFDNLRFHISPVCKKIFCVQYMLVTKFNNVDDKRKTSFLATIFWGHFRLYF